MLFALIGCALPFLAAFLLEPVCSSVSPLYVYAAYAGFIVFSSSVELGVLITLKKALVVKGKENALPFNRYLLAKWCQGQLSSFVTFMHFCFNASALICLKQSGEILEDGQVLHTVSSVLAIVATPILVSSNARRLVFLCKNLGSRPDIHKLLPKMERNTQLAWILNFQASAVAMESTSLSDYIYENGEPIVAGKAKDLPPGFKNPEVKPITEKLLRDKMYFQDYPMLAIMGVHFLATFGGQRIEMIVSLIQIATTALSILSGMVSLRYSLTEKGVDVSQLRRLVGERTAVMDSWLAKNEPGATFSGPGSDAELSKPDADKKKRKARQGKGSASKFDGESSGNDTGSAKSDEDDALSGAGAGAESSPDKLDP